jgi:twinkle protein
MNKQYYDAAEVKISCSQKLKTIISDLYPESKIKGTEARIGSINGEPGSSMAISLDPSKFGSFYDHASDEKGDLISLIEANKNYDYGEAIEWLGANYTTCIKRSYEAKEKKTRPQLAENQKFTKLSKEIIEYAKNVRFISEDALIAYKVQSLCNNPSTACFLSVDDHNQVSKIEYCSTKEKKYWSSIDCDHNIFGKNCCDSSKLKGELIITEGRWDAMSYYELGFPAVSIPSGVKNHQWINEDWEYLQQFHTIYLSFDMDDAGQNEINEIVSRLGIHKCKIISLPLKDASEMLQSKRGDELRKHIESATIPQSGSLISAASLKEETYKLLCEGVENIGDPYFLEDFEIRIRPYEMTLIFGLSFHGKSQFISNQVAFDASNQIQTAIASFEQIPSMTLASFVKQFSNNPHLENEPHEFSKMFDELAPYITIYDSVIRTDPAKLIEDFTYAHKRKGVNRFIIDNVMSLDTDRDNNSSQAAAAHLFREFTKEYPIHLFVIAHPRKPSHENNEKPPMQSDIRGAGEWGDVPENIITVWRNTKKQEDIENMRLDKRPPHEIMNYNQQIPDGKILVRKQRATGKTPLKNVWFHQDIQRFTTSPMRPTGFIVKEKEEDPF